jgi:hypothetical protein
VTQSTPDLSRPTKAAERYIRSTCARMWGRGRLQGLQYDHNHNEWRCWKHAKGEHRDARLRFYRDDEAYRSLGYDEVDET